MRNREDAESPGAQLMLGASGRAVPPIALLLSPWSVSGSCPVDECIASLLARRLASGPRLALHRLERAVACKPSPGARPLSGSQRLAIGSKRTIACRGNYRQRALSCVYPLATLRARLESRFSAQELGDVAFEIEQLARLVEQLLCLARLDSQEQFQFAAFDAHAVALEVARELAPAALETEHYVSAATPDATVPTHGNATLTRLVFRNLIENAIQYTPAGTSITLSADSATVIIADDGPGIAAHTTASLFERFRRGPDASGPGVGLGLAIAKCIMERQGGACCSTRSAAGLFRDGVPEPG